MESFNVIHVPRDGNCFFHCLSYYIKKSSSVIRKECVDFFLKQKKLIESHCFNIDNIKEIYELGIWDVDELDVIPKIAHLLYRINIFIHTEEGNITVFKNRKKYR